MSTLLPSGREWSCPQHLLVLKQYRCWWIETQFQYSNGNQPMSLNHHSPGTVTVNASNLWKSLLIIHKPIVFIKELKSNGSDPILRASFPLNSTTSKMFATVIAAVGPNFGGAYKDYHTPVPVFYKTVPVIAELAPATNHSKLIGIIIGNKIWCLNVVVLTKMI